jgi:hypothetical protein
MICHYCQRTLIETLVNKYPKFKSECEECHTIFRFYQGNDPYLILWEDIFINEKEYLVRILPQSIKYGVTDWSPSFTVACWSEAKINVGWNKVIELQFIPNWTPQTILSKLPAYLPFL